MEQGLDVGESLGVVADERVGQEREEEGETARDEG